MYTIVMCLQKTNPQVQFSETTLASQQRCKDVQDNKTNKRHVTTGPQMLSKITLLSTPVKQTGHQNHCHDYHAKPRYCNVHQ
jgi:hypothetical protein